MSKEHEIAVDVEFDGSDLLSIAFVPLEGDHSLYLVAEHGEIRDEWVRANVVPRLMVERAKYARPVPIDWIRREVAHYLRMVEASTGKRPLIIADWWQDIIRLLRLIDHGDGTCEDVPDLDFSVRRRAPDLSTYVSEVPHNAYYDARSIADAFNKERGE